MFVYRAAHLRISTKYEMASMVVVHRGNFGVKYRLVNRPPSAKIEHLVHCEKIRKINSNKIDIMAGDVKTQNMGFYRCENRGSSTDTKTLIVKGREIFA